jgi:TetR/AcrR family transcriptional regulator
MCAKVKGEEKDKVEAIIAAAQKRFGYYGLCKTTMNEIASDLGMGKASLYYYFPDKENIFEAVIKKEQDAFIEEIEKMLNTSTDASFMLLEYIYQRNAFSKIFLNLAKLKCEVLFNGKPIISKLFDIFKKKETELIKQIIKIGVTLKQFKEIDIEEYASLFIIHMQGIRTVYLKQNDLTELSDADYSIIEKQMIMTANMFVNYLVIK